MPQMHASLHSEFLESVSTTHFSRRTTKTKNIASKSITKPPIKSVVPKRQDLSSEIKKNVVPKRKMGVKILPNNEQPSVSNSLVKNLHGSKPTISRKANPSSSEKSKADPKSKLQKQSKPIESKSTSSMKSKQVSTLSLSSTRKNQHNDSRSNNKPNIIINSRTREEKRQGSGVANDDLYGKQSKSFDNQVKKVVKPNSEKCKKSQSNLCKDANQGSSSGPTKTKLVIKRVEKSRYRQTCDEKFSGKMDTIKEEEFKEIVVINQDVDEAPKSEPIERSPRKPSDSENIAQASAATPDVINRNDNKRKELQQLEEIEKEFVAFLLPWLKLVPTVSNKEKTSTTVKKNVKDTQSTIANRSLNNYLNNLSKVCNLTNFLFIGGEILDDMEFQFEFVLDI